LKSRKKNKSDLPTEIDKISGSVMTITLMRAPAYASIKQVHALTAL